MEPLLNVLPGVVRVFRVKELEVAHNVVDMVARGVEVGGGLVEVNRDSPGVPKEELRRRGGWPQGAD